MKKAIAFLTGSIPEKSVLFNGIYLLFRLHAGLSIADGAGLAKVFHKINEKGPDEWGNLVFGVPDWFTKQVGGIGFTFISPSFWAHLAVYGEFVGGLLVAFGLLTRISALQLAFQFFVISYIWYGDPAPIVGMYYQQLYFFAFLLVFAVGDGKYSPAGLWKSRSWRTKISKPIVATSCLLLCGLDAPAQTTDGRVNFTVTNASLKTQWIQFKHFNGQTQTKADYGYSLNALSSHATNLPAPVRVYGRKGGKMELLFVVRMQDNGKSFSVTKDHETSREDALEAAQQELNEQTHALDEASRDKTVEQTAKEKGLKMVTFRVKGSSFVPLMVHVRVQLPWDTGKKSQHGFSTSLSRFGSKKMSYPIGSKVYSCAGPYWKAGANYAEKLIVTVDEEKENYLFAL